MRYLTGLLLLCLPLLSNAQQMTIKFEVPALDVSPYHRPYVAIWLETPKRKGVHTIAIWYEKDDWLKDLRQWWRKLGRKDAAAYDATSGATRKPGTYTVHWNGLDQNQQPIAAGEYFLNLEASREAGGRDFMRQKIRWGERGEPQQFELQGDLELGNIHIIIE